MTLADDLAALRANGVIVADFHADGKLAHVEMGPVVMPFADEDEPVRETMTLPTGVVGGDGRIRGGPATAPRASANGKPRDLMRDLILADLAAAPAMDENDLPEESTNDEPEPAREHTEGTETRLDLGDGGQPPLSAEEAESRGGQGA